jgi:hypothetical protein
MLRIDLPFGYVELRYIEPQEPPRAGSDWPEELDYPGVQAIIRLPTDGTSSLMSELTTGGKLLGDTLDTTWGSYDPDSVGYRFRKSAIYRNPTLLASEDEALSVVAFIRGQLSEIRDKREARLAKRKATLSKAVATHGVITHDSD